jgi:MFS family permease
VVFVIGWTFTVATGLGFYSLPVYLNVLVHSRGFGLTTVSYAVSSFFLVSAVVNVPLGRLIRRVEPRWVMLGGSVLAGLSLFLLGRVDAVWQLYLDFTIFGCGFSASSYLPGTAVIVGLFDRDRARALALALTGGSVGGVVVAPLLTRIVDARGLTGTAPWLGLAYLLLGGLPVVVAIRGHLAAPPAASSASASASADEAAAGAAAGVSYAVAVRSAAFVLVTVSFGVLLADQVGTQVQIVAIASAMGVANAGIAVSIMASATVVGRLIGAFALSRLPVVGFSAVMGVVQGASFGVLALLPGLAGLAVGTVLFGITIGNLTVLIPLVVVELFGLTDYPRIYAVSQFGASVGTAGGPAVLAWLHSGFGSYRLPLLILAGISGAASVVVARLRPPAPGPAAVPAPGVPAPGPAVVPEAELADRCFGGVLQRGLDRRGLIPGHDAELGRADRVVVLVELGPVRVVELVHGEARVEGVVEAHVVDALVHRLLDQQRGHGGRLGDPPGERQGLVGQLVDREHLADHAQLVRLVDVDGVAGQQQLLGLARAELPRVGEVLHAAHAQPGPHHVGEAGVVGGHDQVAGPHQHQAGREHRALHLGDGDLAQVAPAEGVLEEVVPLLQHPVFGPFSFPAVDGDGRMLVRAGLVLLSRFS